jgi:hypothetical protein
VEGERKGGRILLVFRQTIVDFSLVLIGKKAWLLALKFIEIESVTDLNFRHDGP